MACVDERPLASAGSAGLVWYQHDACLHYMSIPMFVVVRDRR